MHSEVKIRLKVALCFDAVDAVVLPEELLAPLAFKYQKYFTFADALMSQQLHTNRAEGKISNGK